MNTIGMHSFYFNCTEGSSLPIIPFRNTYVLLLSTHQYGRADTSIMIALYVTSGYTLTPYKKNARHMYANTE